MSVNLNEVSHATADNIEQNLTAQLNEIESGSRFMIADADQSPVAPGSDLGVVMSGIAEFAAPGIGGVVSEGVKLFASSALSLGKTDSTAPSKQEQERQSNKLKGSQPKLAMPGEALTKGKRVRNGQALNAKIGSNDLFAKTAISSSFMGSKSEGLSVKNSPESKALGVTTSDLKKSIGHAKRRKQMGITIAAGAENLTAEQQLEVDKGVDIVTDRIHDYGGKDLKQSALRKSPEPMKPKAKAPAPITA